MILGSRGRSSISEGTPSGSSSAFRAGTAGPAPAASRVRVGREQVGDTGPARRNGAVAASPASRSPDQHPSTTTIGVPCTYSGRNGKGGAVVRLTSGQRVRRRRRPSGSRQGRSRPGPQGRRRGRRGPSDRPRELELEGGDDPEVAATPTQTPEELRVLVGAGVQVPAVRGDESAPRRLSQASPAADEPADTAAGVKPATPVEETSPPVTASPNGCVSASTSPQTHPPCRTLRPRYGSRSRHRRQVDQQAAVHGGEPGEECPPPRTASVSPSLRARSTARMTSATPRHRASPQVAGRARHSRWCVRGRSRCRPVAPRCLAARRRTRSRVALPNGDWVRSGWLGRGVFLVGVSECGADGLGRFKLVGVRGAS